MIKEEIVSVVKSNFMIKEELVPVVKSNFMIKVAKVIPVV